MRELTHQKTYTVARVMRRGCYILTLPKNPLITSWSSGAILIPLFRHPGETPWNNSERLRAVVHRPWRAWHPSQRSGEGGHCRSPTIVPPRRRFPPDRQDAGELGRVALPLQPLAVNFSSSFTSSCSMAFALNERESQLRRAGGGGARTTADSKSADTCVCPCTLQD